ncbi:ABC transporter permease [Chryseosolibacter indicus]|uniref:ABC transporter permease n=1 Tax=Chryseosolibacter indicus TaxID=2782351 RepID=A0ABS5VX98_9BACT|nr:ABC transporter permease [Chryseosolibacter indicus]MBT1705472.1 ABC transporter permease [Chryseosolibacter indicus]
MIKNYILVAFRSLKRNRFFSVINIFGLAISMSICLGIIMLVADQLTYDRYNTKRDRIYRVITRNLNPDGSPSGNDYATSPLPLAKTLADKYAGIEDAVRIRRGFGNPWIEFEQNVNIPLAGFFADPKILDVFEYELEYGDATTALMEPYSVVLTKKAARKLFKQENPVGEVIKVGKLGEYKVTGVIKEKLFKSHIVFEALASYATVESLEANNTIGKDDNWDNYTAGWVYLLLNNKTSINEIEGHLNEITKKYRTDDGSASEKQVLQHYLQNICDVTPGPFINNPIGPFMPLIFVYFFGGLALIVMLTSCFNYTNLSIARSLTRAREIGVRKVNGASRFQIFGQFIAEAIALSLIALLASLVLLVLVKPFLINLKFAQVLRWDLEGNFYVYMLFLIFSVVVGILAGFFPAAILSKFQPVKVLKNAVGRLKLFSRLGLRKTLLVVQFSLSLIFIISVVLLYNQLMLFIKADHGFDMQNRIVARLNDASYQLLKNELKQYSNIENVAAASHVPASGVTYGDMFKREISEASINMSYYSVDEHYLSNLNLSLIAGENFKELAEETNKDYILINESSVKAFHFSSAHDAVGKYLFNESDSSKLTIIGVVKDYNHQILMSKINPMALRYNPEQYHIIQIKYNGSYEQAAKALEAAWQKVNPTLKIDYNAFKEEIQFFYKTVFSDFVSIIGVISMLAIIISCLGLLGMATYTTETRLKEISIRKVLGSGDSALVFLLSKGFILLLVIAITIAVPVAWMINNLWLQHIAYRTQIDFSVIATSVSIVVILGCVTIASQTWRAAYANPVDNLRNE